MAGLGPGSGSAWGPTSAPGELGPLGDGTAAKATVEGWAASWDAAGPAQGRECPPGRPARKRRTAQDAIKVCGARTRKVKGDRGPRVCGFRDKNLGQGC